MHEKGNDFTIRIGTWNTEWKKPGGKAGNIIRERLAATECHVLCVTEGYAGILPDGGHVIDAGKDWGCPIKKGRRKVLLWSKHPWTPHTRARGSAELPNGRFVAGSTQTPSGERLTVVGVCIPWFGAHVNYCNRNRLPWQDHVAWLAGFEKLRFQLPMSRTVVLGDFNQTIPRTRAPHRAYGALKQAFEGFRFATEAGLAGVSKSSIDHIAHSPDLTRKSIGIWPFTKAGDGKRLSDHFGVWADFGTC